MKKIFSLLFLAPLALIAQTNFNETSISNSIKVVKINDQISLGYSTQSGVKIIYKDGLPFKDLNKNGQLDKYEDWRVNVVDRAKDLASKMTVDQMAGLMLYSRHQAIPAQEAGMFVGTYGGKPFSQSGASASDLSDQQKRFFNQRQSTPCINDLC